MTLHEFRTRRANLSRVNEDIGSMPLTESTVLVMEDAIRDEAAAGMTGIDVLLTWARGDWDD